MARRTSESARILNFFADATLDKAEVVYELVRDLMTKRLAPGKALKKRKKAKEAEPAAKEAQSV